MDRLLCGDVGYGKTEVAMRAAFKALADSKQVAVLAPTTVLAFQHYETFRRRFAAFPVRIEMLSRFRSEKEQKKTLEDLEAGKVDIVIGTHRLLSQDVKFQDLGLLVVDEEQRFGVAHKERLKEMRKNVDVLTMSATPIPRTLHMSLVGLARHERDRDAAEGPPGDSDHGRALQRNAGAARDRRGAGARRAGVFRSQPRGIDCLAGVAGQAAGAEGARRGGPRPDARDGTRKGDAEIHPQRSGRSGLDHDHRERPRHSAREHHHHQSRRPHGAFRALPASRARGPLESARLRLSAGSDRRRRSRPSPASAWRRSRNSAIWAPASASPRSIWNCAAPAICWAASSTATSKRSASTCTAR